MIASLPIDVPEIFFAIVFVVLFLWELAQPNRRYGFNLAWHARLAFLLLASIALTALLNVGLSRVFGAYILLPQSGAFLSNLSPVVGGLIIYLIYTFINYWWHRARHANQWLWRGFHQIHHSTHQLSTLTAFYAHPLDYFSTFFIINAMCLWVFGLDFATTSWATVITGLFEVWEHTNIRTPRWLGYFVVRPEMHRVHHELLHHRKNYGIPIWDALFGTYENSLRDVECGFEDGLEERLGDMLCCKDVHQPVA